MVITDTMVWAHLPKAAGTATQEMLTAVPGLVLFQAPIDSNDKHDSFWAHGEAVEGKLRAMNIRRLPSWVLSTAHHKAVSGVWPDYEPLPMPSVEEMVESAEPDDVLRWMTDGVPVDRWLRMENLAEDVEALLIELGTPAATARSAVAIGALGRQAVRPRRHQQFHGPSRSARMYERNPGWGQVERRCLRRHLRALALLHRLLAVNSRLRDKGIRARPLGGEFEPRATPRRRDPRA